MISLLPVVVMKMSHSPTTSSSGETWEPSIAACNAQIGSISETMTRPPAAFKEAAEPLPTSPEPATQQVLPAIMTSVALMIPSGKECLQPYKLSNLHLVTESLTLIAGNNNSPCFCISYNLLTPVVVSSETPTHVSTILCHLFGFVFKLAAMMFKTHFISALSVVDGSGTAPVASNAF